MNPPSPDLVTLINDLLNHTREVHGFRSDEKLAHLLGVSDTTIYRWRRGIVDTGTRTLLPLAVIYAHVDKSNIAA